jgi:2'-hydroxyisoflavone reductase
MDILIIGGTSFLGRAAAHAALERGHRVTTFNRGRTGADVPGVEALRGDRESDDDLAQLAGRHFDGVLDTCGFVPRVVGRSVATLRDAADHYVYVSSCSATTTWPAVPTPDGADGKPCASDAGPDDGDYGVLKAGCERAVTEGYGDRATVMRAGLILGPHENVGRLTWWLSRMARGGEVLAPGDPCRPMQLVDARDLAAFAVGAIERRTGGTFNTTGPRGNATMGGWLGTVRDVTGAGATLAWVEDAFLVEREVGIWQELPLWSPVGDEDAVWEVETVAAEAAGLRSRPVVETVRDTWAWMVDAGVTPDGADGRFGGNGIAPEKEAALLADWRARANAVS